MGLAASLPRDWSSVLRAELDDPYFEALESFVKGERRSGAVYPPEPQVFAAFARCPWDAVRVVIVGQDPYHGAGQAHGLCFSVPRGVRVPPSLANVHRELADDFGVAPPGHGSLECWAAQGVLLLNTVLTVRDGTANSHAGRGWERFTDAVLRAVSDGPRPVVFLLWGNAARRKAALVDRRRHGVVEGAHPSPLSARLFRGSRPFSAVNRVLVAAGRDPVDWSIPPMPAA